MQMSYNWQKTERAAGGVSVSAFVARAGPGNELAPCPVERKSSQKMQVRKQKCQMTFFILSVLPERVSCSGAASTLPGERERSAVNT